MWQFLSLMSAFKSQSHEDHQEFKAIQGYLARPFPNKNETKQLKTILDYIYGRLLFVLMSICPYVHL